MCGLKTARSASPCLEQQGAAGQGRQRRWVVHGQGRTKEALELVFQGEEEEVRLEFEAGNTCFDGILGQGGHTFEAQAIHDLAAMVFHGACGQGQKFGDLF